MGQRDGEALGGCVNGDNRDCDYFMSKRKQMHQNASSHFEKIFSENEKMMEHLEAQEKELEWREERLLLKQAQIHGERRQLILDQERCERAALERKKNDEKLSLLVEEHKKQQEKLHKRITELENLLDAKQALELAIQRMRGALEGISHIGKGEDVDLKKKKDELEEKLKATQEDLEALKELNRTLIMNERRGNDELQLARTELIRGLKDLFSFAFIGVKRVGDLDNKPFLTASKRTFLDNEEAKEKAVELYSLWESHLRDLDWHPFKIIMDQGKYKELINEEDEKLKNLKNEYGDVVYEAVITALEELNEYNPNGRSAITELWNFKEKRKASLKEGVEFVLKQWKKLKGRRYRSSVFI